MPVYHVLLAPTIAMPPAALFRSPPPLRVWRPRTQVIRAVDGRRNRRLFDDANGRPADAGPDRTLRNADGSSETTVRHAAQLAIQQVVGDRCRFIRVVADRLHRAIDQGARVFRCHPHGCAAIS
jgi:hypothetical protein